jgi:hypothetical protein
LAILRTYKGPTPPRRNKFRENTSLRLVLVLFLPILLLGIDFYFFPIFYSAHVDNENMDLNDLLIKRSIRLGIYRAHGIHVSIDDINDPQYLDFLKSQPNALIISTFIDSDHSASGALQSVVLHRLQVEAPGDYLVLKTALDGVKEFTRGQVIDIALHIPTKNYHRFPLNEILVVALPRGHPDAADVEAGLRRALQIADRKKISNIFVPCLATRWDDNGKNSLSLSDFFIIFFKAIPQAERPHRLYVSLYYGWPTFQLEDATEALNAAWQETFTDSEGVSQFYRLDIRLILCLLALCLVICAFVVQLTVKNVLIISVAFVGLAYGSKTWIDLLIQGDEHLALFVKIGVFTAIALTFPVLVTWNPKDIFAAKPDVTDQET